MKHLRAFVARWPELVYVLPAALAVMWAAYYIIPAIDPRSGIDGWGGLWASLTVMFNAILAACFASGCVRWNFAELTDRDERDLVNFAVGAADDSGDEALGADAGPAPTDYNPPRRFPTRRGGFVLPPTWQAAYILTLERLTWFAVWIATFAALQG